MGNLDKYVEDVTGGSGSDVLEETRPHEETPEHAVKVMHDDIKARIEALKDDMQYLYEAKPLKTYYDVMVHIDAANNLLNN